MSHKAPSPMIAILLIFGGTVFGWLGALHAFYILLDLHSPRRFLDGDPSVAHAMANSALRLSGGRLTRGKRYGGIVEVDCGQANTVTRKPRCAKVRHSGTQMGSPHAPKA